MNEDIKKIGELCKNKRKELGFSLKEVENSTSIRMNHLESIEEGKYEHFLSSVYIYGFIKQYASFLGLDGDKLIKDHPGALNLPAEKHDFAYGIGTLEMRGSQGGGVKWLPNAVWAGISAVALVAAWYLAKYLGVI